MPPAVGCFGTLLTAAALALVHPQQAKASCGLLRDGPCPADSGIPIGQGLRLTAQDTSSDPVPRQRTAKPLNTIRDVFAAIHACWLPPPMDQAQEGMEIAVRLSFTRDGGILGEPRFTYVTRDVTQQLRTAYQRAVVATLARCTPLRFTPELGGAIAGRPFAIRFVDNRPRPERRA
ncbi:MAG: hypothetical protein ACLPKB_22915 [Xanthobacteraceae bacterium]